MTEKETIYLKDYTQPPFLVDTVDLHFELAPDSTTVVATMKMRMNGDNSEPLILYGENIALDEVLLNGRLLSDSEYVFADGKLVIEKVPSRFTVQIKNRINPENNTALEGLYRSSGNYCSQCEPEGFRRITCYPDRPDIMAVFTTTIVANKKECPVMLAGGNLVEEGELPDGRHFARWHDPHRKPSYLFALVAGDLVCIEDSYTTISGRRVGLYIYVEERNRDKCEHAMESLRKSMQWDEEKYGLEYDLDRYMIVAVDDFNMGAMENKGLNIFNSKFVLARPETATDQDYEGIEGVIGHEYFHNWTGNRITCRDWFQLSLKEGLTVFRDQEFSGDMGSRPVKRINDASVIRNFQFREDAGPISHSVRPDSFVEINNFYTLTVYNKGAEVIRMIHTFLGKAGFRRGMDLYFERHDGQAVTCDDFVRAMEDANSFDLSQFKRWYSQAGTPELEVETSYNEDEREYRLAIKQSCPATPGQERKEPFFMPVNIALLLKKNGETILEETLTVDKEKEEFVFSGIDEPVACSFLRDFSAPVKVNMARREDELAFLMACDSNHFNRWDAAQQLAMKGMLDGVSAWGAGSSFKVAPAFHEPFALLLADKQVEPAFLALALTIPTENWISQQLDVVDPEAVFSTRQSFCFQLGSEHRDALLARYQQLGSDRPYYYSSSEAGRRSLRNCLLRYLLSVSEEDGVGEGERNVDIALGEAQYHEADNMTDKISALAAVVNAKREAGDRLLADFYKTWEDEPLVVDKWLSMQATCTLAGTLARVKSLTAHSAFSLKNPNKIRSLIGAFCSANHRQFHARSGEGYVFLADYIITLDSLNPQIAARLLTPLTSWRRYDQSRRDLIKTQLIRIRDKKDLSADVGEIVSRSLLK